MSETLQLQVNTAGAWKTVIRFEDVEPGNNFLDVRRAGLFLHRAAPGSAWRIATCDSVPSTLYRLDERTSGIWQAS